MKLGRTEEKILLLLLTGVGLSLSCSPKQHFRLIHEAAQEWKRISRTSLPRSVKLLQEKRLVKVVRRSDGVYVANLTTAGEERATLARLMDMTLPPLKHWDGRWRIVMFDIPETKTTMRNILRQCLRNWGFEELQKSVFVTPKNCRDAVELLIHENHVESHVCFIEAKHISQDSHLRKRFGLRG